MVVVPTCGCLPTEASLVAVRGVGPLTLLSYVDTATTVFSPRYIRFSPHPPWYRACRGHVLSYWVFWLSFCCSQASSVHLYLQVRDHLHRRPQINLHKIRTLHDSRVLNSSPHFAGSSFRCIKEVELGAVSWRRRAGCLHYLNGQLLCGFMGK